VVRARIFLEVHNETILTLVAHPVAGCLRCPSAEPVSYTIEMSEYAFTPADLEVQVGQQVTLNLVNQAQLEHELMIGRRIDYADNRPNGYQEDLFAVAGIQPEISGGSPSKMDGGHMHDNPGTMVVVQPEDQASLTFTVTDDMLGEWELSRFSQEGVHYAAGMQGKMVVVK
jgi:uncharacterized cupredoxin-like copper-binding protein